MAEFLPSANPDEKVCEDLSRLSIMDKNNSLLLNRTTSTDNIDDPESIINVEKPINTLPGAVKLRDWLNQLLRITMSDGRVLVGMFFCTDKDANIILGACSEYLPEGVVKKGEAAKEVEEPRILGLVMVPGKHIVNISVDVNKYKVVHEFS